jgi:uncharacterized protein DUF3311
MTIGGRRTVRAKDEFWQASNQQPDAGETTSRDLSHCRPRRFGEAGNFGLPGEFRVRGVVPGGWHVRSIRWLAVLPFIGLVIGPFFVNRPTPFVLGLPFLLAWIVAWILLTSLIMTVIYWFDPANQEDGN